ncbi:MAG TPA: M1 family aminopeptidase [Pyrinomonadaceae bacterium]|nr:M1 family aminopeptidase [Pyrinomonadaceae bacterium]
MVAISQPSSSLPPIEPGVSLELARWRAAHYSDVRYKLNLTLEKVSPVLKGTIEIRVNVKSSPPYEGGVAAPAVSGGGRGGSPIILDWRKIKGHEEKSTISSAEINGIRLIPAGNLQLDTPDAYHEYAEHLIFRDGVVAGENVIKLDFTSPILTSGSAITRYIDKEDGSEYIYSLFVPSDASTAFPVFDQPDLKAMFELNVVSPYGWTVVSNSETPLFEIFDGQGISRSRKPESTLRFFKQTKPISTYVFAFAAGPFERVSEPPASAGGQSGNAPNQLTVNTAGSERIPPTDIFVRKSQAEKLKPHAAEVFRLNREAIKYFEEYFDYKFPFPKYDLVLIPEFPFGGMEHAGATFLRESSIIFPQEPTKNDHISRALLIFHEASHQWFGDTVTMRWFDDLWLKEGFATFTAYKAMERIMPEMNAWKVFYERVKQAAYQTDSTKGTTPIYQEISNLSAAKSAYGAIVYSKAPAFLRQAEFYLGEDKFQTAVRAFLRKHEFKNAGWEDLVSELETSSKKDLTDWANIWVKRRGLSVVKTDGGCGYDAAFKQVLCDGIDTNRWIGAIRQAGALNKEDIWFIQTNILYRFSNKADRTATISLSKSDTTLLGLRHEKNPELIFPNYGDYGYGIFLLDDKSRDYVLKNIQNENDPFLRSMMWGALWDSVREGELDPRVFLETAIRNLPAEEDETMAASIAGRVGTAMNYYVADKTREELAPRIEHVFSDKMRTAQTLGQRITFYRAFLNAASSEKARGVLKAMLSEPPASAGGQSGRSPNSPAVNAGGSDQSIPLRTKDKFDIVTRLLILGDPEAPALLAELEKTETSDDAKRYAYAARAGIPTPENKAKFWNDFTNNKEISESWIEAAFVPWNSIRHSDLTLPYLQKALQELPNHKRDRKIFFVNGWLAAFIGGQRSEEALAIINKFLADNPKLDNDLRLKILENADLIERAVKIRKKSEPPA